MYISHVIVDYELWKYNEYTKTKIATPSGKVDPRKF